MPIPTLSAADPLVVPAKTYDSIWVEEVVISAPDINAPVNARVRLRRFGIVDGVAELESAPGQWVEVSDVLTGAAADPELAAVVGSLMVYVAKIGREQGVVATKPTPEPAPEPTPEPTPEPAPEPTE
jgi:hypothetical protein